MKNPLKIFFKSKKPEINDQKASETKVYNYYDEMCKLLDRDDIDDLTKLHIAEKVAEVEEEMWKMKVDPRTKKYVIIGLVKRLVGIKEEE